MIFAELPVIIVFCKHLKDGSEIFGANKFQVLCDYSPSIDGGKALDEFIKEKSICIK